MPLNAFEYVQSVIRKSLVRKRISLLVGEIRQLGGKFDLSNMRWIGKFRVVVPRSTRM